MAQVSPTSPRPPNAAAAPGPLPVVRLEVRSPTIRPASYDVPDTGFVIGSVPGCDLRLPGTDLPPVVCLIARNAAGASIRKLVPTFSILINGQSVTTSLLVEGDQVTLGSVELLVHVQYSSGERKPEGGGPKESFLPARDIAPP